MYKRIKNFFMQPFWYLYYFILMRLYKNKKIFLYWFCHTQNFGDSINPLFVKALSGKDIIYVNPIKASMKHTFAIGSIIEHCSVKSTIWGSGFISETSLLKHIPYEVRAVRGPKSRKRFLDLGVKCPEVYGDPALLLPKIYNPKISKKYKLGFIPHHSDKANIWLQENILNNDEYIIIDLQKENVWEVIDDILSCEGIVSSSLHGIITADAYSIPSVWIQFSDKVIGKGFKFLDYFESVGRKDLLPLCIDENTSIDDIKNLFYEYKINIDLEKLLNAAPFEINIKSIWAKL